MARGVAIHMIITKIKARSPIDAGRFGSDPKILAKNGVVKSTIAM
jgi:hypothetical protein